MPANEQSVNKAVRLGWCWGLYLGLLGGQQVVGLAELPPARMCRHWLTGDHALVVTLGSSTGEHQSLGLAALLSRTMATDACCPSTQLHRARQYCPSALSP